MKNDDIVNALKSLIQLDIDAVYAYNQAIEAIDAPQIRANLIAFRADHERHIVDLSQAVSRYGTEPPTYSRDIKGFLMEGFTAVQSAFGVERALKAMRSNERLTNTAYHQALALDLPADARLVVEQSFADEVRHMAYIEQALDKRLWEEQAPTLTP